MKPAAPATSLPFLARLARAARGSVPSVRAALPSRFESKGPADATPTEQAFEAPADDGRAQRPVPEPAGPASDAASPVAASPAPWAAPEAAVALHAMARPDPRALRVCAAEVTRAPAGDAPSGRSPAPSPPPGPRGPAAGPASPARQESRDASREASGKPSLKVAPEPFAQSARPAVEVRPPLRESTVAQRAASPRAEPQDVVQVTIDRIDVHLPPAGTTERRASSRARAAPAVSLGEYLRQRDKPRHGGNGP